MPQDTSGAQQAAGQQANNQQAGQQQAGQQAQQAVGQQPPATWEAWLEGQTTEVKALYEQHTSGLKSALESEREQRKGLAKQVKELADKQTEGSEARKTLDEMSKRIEAAELQTAFYEDAIQQGVSNLRLAWLAMQAKPEEYSRRGKIDWSSLKADYPELFKTPPPPPANAGAGTQTAPARAGGMNDFIRAASGRRT